MDRISLGADVRTVLGKKVKTLRKEGKLPAHVFGKSIETEHISIDGKTFLQVFTKVGETGLIDLKTGGEKVKPVLIREVQYDPMTGAPIHVDFYQVNLSVKVKVPVPLELIGEQPEKVHLGEAIVLQTLNEVEVEALPTDLIEKIEVDISTLQNIDDAITVADLNLDKDKITILAEPEEIVVKLAPAVTAEMEALLEEQATETAQAAEQATVEEVAEGEPASVEAMTGEEGAEVIPAEGGTPTEGEAAPEGGQAQNKENSEEKP